MYSLGWDYLRPTRHFLGGGVAQHLCEEGGKPEQNWDFVKKDRNRVDPG